MRFLRQTLLSVCLVLPFVVWGQPVANDDNANTNEDASVSFNVLSNDIPGPGIDPATVDLDVSTTDIDNSFSTSNYEFTVDLLGEVTFTPAPDFAGVVTLYYTVQNSDDDPLTSNQALITVTVAPVNDLPVISSILDQDIDEDTQTSALAFTINDIETAPGALIVSAESDNTALIPDLNIIITGNDGDRMVQVTPLPDQNGIATITLSVS
ncbi:MAG: hypothetical protein C0490_21555, partial [Marivirga sp.]|nr:hypothetical protein [Marivirga sp.]